jgi:hypothetical protein
MDVAMSPATFTIATATFAGVVIFVAWLKFHEHLHIHRHDHGPHGEHTHPHHRIRRRSQ